MLTILPLPQGAEKERFIREAPGAGNDAEVLALREGEELLGTLVVDVRSSTVRLFKMEIPGETDSPQARLCGDSLLRAAAVFGMDAGAYRLESLLEGWDSFLIARGFQREEKKLYCLLSKIIRKCGD